MAITQLQKRGILKAQEKWLRLREDNLFKAQQTGDVNDLLKAELANEKAIKMASFLGKEYNKNQPSIKNLEDERKSYVVDPWAFNASFGFKDKPVSMTYNLLRSMAKTSVINAIIRTRINQIVSFSEPQRNKYTYGYVIQKKRRFGEEEGDLNSTEKKEIDFVYNFIENCGINQNWGGDDFDGFLKKIARDSLTLDQMTFEIIRDKKGRPLSFYAVDAATIRLSKGMGESKIQYEKEIQQGNSRKVEEINGYFPSYVQIYQNQVFADFYPWEMCFGVRNPSTDIRLNGYGVSELEEMITLITSILWGEEYNRKFFSQGSSPKGLLRVKSNMPQHRISEFKQEWNATMRGVWNSWQVPVLNGDEVEWVDLQKSNRDMEFSNWLEFLIKVGCAIYSIDPAEVNFPLQGSSNQSSMFEGNNEARLKHSKDKGLYPILKFIQKKINRYLIQPLTYGKYEFLFAGLDSMTPSEELEMDVKSVSNFMTVNEIRAKRGHGPLEGYDFVLNPTVIQKMNADQQAAMFGGELEPEDVVDQESEEGEEIAEETAKAFENPFEKSFEQYLKNYN